MEGCARKARRDCVRRKEWGVPERKQKKRIERREIMALGREQKSEKHVEVYGGLSEGIGMETYLHGHMGFEKTLKLRFRVRDLPERRLRYASRREEKKVDAQMCPCGK